MKKCTQALRYICDNLDADMNSPRCVEIRRHIDGCTDCSAYLDSMKKTVALYRRYPVGEIPSDVHKHLLESLRKERGKTGRSAHRRPL